MFNVQHNSNFLILYVAVYKYDNFQIDKRIDRPNGRNRSVADQESTIIAKEASLCAIASMASDPIHLLLVVPSMAFLGHVLPYTGMSDAKIAVNVPSIFKIKTQIDYRCQFHRFYKWIYFYFIFRSVEPI